MPIEDKETDDFLFMIEETKLKLENGLSCPRCGAGTVSAEHNCNSAAPESREDIMRAINGNSDEEVFCARRDCRNTIPASSQFRFCEKCRVFAARDSAAILYSPLAPPSLIEESKQILTILTSLTGTETLEYVNRIERTYLEMRKYCLANKIENSSRRVAKSLSEMVEESRSAEDRVAGENKARRFAKATAREGKKAKTRMEVLRGIYPGLDDEQIEEQMKNTDF